MPTVPVTRLLSSLSQLKLLCQTTGQCEEQILSNNKKKMPCACQHQLIQVTIHIINVSRHALRDLLHISRDTLLAVFLRTMCVRHVDFKSD